MRQPARVLVLASLMVAGCSSSATVEPPKPGSLDIVTDKGPVHGSSDGVARSFLGIPYAAPPVGALRFMPPKPADAWTAPRDGSSFGPDCAQFGNSGELSPSSSEDCLYVNVWAPAHEVKNAPVLVWIHGGGFLVGSGSASLTRGGPLVEKADMIVVSLNYRMGPLGFLSHPALAKAEGVAISPSQGLLDQQAALAWVHRNVAAFGGDPANVMVVGESAGATSVCSQLAMPGSKDLFARAVVESGLCSSLPLLFQDGARAEDQGTRLATALGCPSDDTAVACMQAKPLKDVMTALPLRHALFGATGDTYAPTVDGVALPRAPLDAMAVGQFNEVPTIVGSNLNEGQLFGWLWGTPAITPTELRAALGLVVAPSKIDVIAARYPVDTDSPTAFVHVLDDVLTCMARQTARGLAAAGAPTYLYEFTYPYAVAAVPNVVATHSYELPFVFRNGYAGAAMSDDDLIVADNVDGYWLSLGKTGDPSAARAKGTVAWPPYTATDDQHVVLDETTSIGKGLKSETCDFWDGLLK